MQVIKKEYHISKNNYSSEVNTFILMRVYNDKLIHAYIEYYHDDNPVYFIILDKKTEITFKRLGNKANMYIFSTYDDHIIDSKCIKKELTIIVNTKNKRYHKYDIILNPYVCTEQVHNIQ
jgi:hypothetical protein